MVEHHQLISEFRNCPLLTAHCLLPAAHCPLFFLPSVKLEDNI
jgi:hypothetical protein